MRLLWIRPKSQSPRWLLYSPHFLPHPDALSAAPTAHNTLVRRLIRFGENKWSEFGAAPANTMKGQIYLLGQRLIKRLPIQEKMWWRVEGYAGGHAGEGNSLVIEHGRAVNEQDPADLAQKLHYYMQQHKSRWLFNTFLSLPILFLTILPFVKLALAWVVFRAVTHHRAYLGCKWVLGRLPMAQYQHGELVESVEERLDKGLLVGDNSDIDSDLISAVSDRFTNTNNKQQ